MMAGGAAVVKEPAPHAPADDTAGQPGGAPGPLGAPAEDDDQADQKAHDRKRHQVKHAECAPSPSCALLLGRPPRALRAAPRFDTRRAGRVHFGCTGAKGRRAFFMSGR